MRHDIEMGAGPADTTGGDVFLHAPSFLPSAVASTVGYESIEPTPRFHRGLPSPYLTFIIALNEPVVVGDSLQHLATGDSTSLNVITAGLHTSAAYIEQRAGQAGIQLAVHPLAARSLFGMPAEELMGHSYDGADVLGADVRTVRDQLVETSDWPQRFRREFGIGLKTFNRLLRFHRAVRTITDTVAVGRPVSLSDVAVECGYADQSHLTRDFLAFTGATPTGWISEELGNIHAGGHRTGEQDPPAGLPKTTSA